MSIATPLARPTWQPAPLPTARGDAPARLAAAREVIEGKFLELGVTLEKSVEVVSGLVASLDQLTSLFSATAVDSASEKLSAAAAELSGLAGSRSGQRERFQRLAATGRQLGSHIDDMQRALRYLRVFAVNIKVTAGTVPGAVVLFEGFAEEIRGAVEDGRTQLDEFGRDLDQLGGLVSAALIHENELDERCNQVLPAVPMQLTADALTLSSHHKRIAAVAAEVGAVARGLQGKVAMALCGLQIGDTVRQRVEHVETGLAILDRRQAAGQANPVADNLVRAMLAAQLDDIVESFDSEVGKVAQSLEGLARDARTLLQLREAARGAGGRGGKAGDLASLEASLEQAMALVAQMGATEAAALNVGQSAESTAQGLTQRISSIRDIKTTIHSMALNAHLKCVRLGDAGRPLSVVAVELRQHADALGETAGQAESILVHMGGGETAEAEDSGAVRVGELLETAAAPIREAEGKMGAELTRMASQGEAVIQALQQATGRLNFQGAVSDVLAACAHQIRPGDLAELNALDEATATALNEMLSEIGKTYTMARERKIQAAYVPPAPGSDDDGPEDG